MYYTGLSKDVKMVSVCGDNTVEGLIAADFSFLDGDELEVACICQLGDALAENIRAAILSKW